MGECHLGLLFQPPFPKSRFPGWQLLKLQAKVAGTGLNQKAARVVLIAQNGYAFCLEEPRDIYIYIVSLVGLPTNFLF